MNWWKKTLVGGLSVFTLWTSAEIGSSALAQHYENKGKENLSLAVGALQSEDMNQVKMYADISRDLYAEAIWWGMATEKFGLYSHILQLAGREEQYTPEGLEVLLNLEKALEGIESKENNNEEGVQPNVQML